MCVYVCVWGGISGKGLTIEKEDFLWLGAKVPLLGNGRGVTERIPEQATKGRHFDLNSTQWAHTDTQTNPGSQSSGALPSGLNQLKDGGKSRCFTAVVGCDLKGEGSSGRLAGGGH